MIRSISMEQFFGHRSTTLDLPERGLVLVRGENGHGKSAIVEAVAWGLWGKTLRSTPPFTEDSATSVSVQLGPHTIGRRRVSGRTSAFWKRSDAEVPQFETTSKLQAALENELGTFEEWQRSNVFTARGVSSFALATDAQRKRALETMLGLHRFEKAETTARVALQAAKLDEATARGEALAAKAALERAQAHYTWASGQTLLYTVDRAMVDSLELEWRRADTNFEAQTRLAYRSRLDMETARVQCAQARAEAQRVEQLLAGHNSRCETCGQIVALDAETLQGLESKREETARAHRTAHEREVHCTEVSRAASSAEVEARTAMQTASLRYNEALNALRREEQHNSTLAPVLAAAEKQLFEAECALDEANVKLAQRTRELLTAQAVVRVVSVTGVRAHLLSRMLSAVESEANHWLATLFERAVTLKLSVESDRIVLDVQGIGGGHGYAGCSAGQQRRIDIALLLALGSVARGTRAASTLWCDEVFDALDASGVECAAQALTAEASSRCVVVITHNEVLASLLRPVAAQSVVVKDGAIHDT